MRIIEETLKEYHKVTDKLRSFEMEFDLARKVVRDKGADEIIRNLEGLGCEGRVPVTAGLYLTIAEEAVKRTQERRIELAAKLAACEKLLEELEEG